MLCTQCNGLIDWLIHQYICVIMWSTFQLIALTEAKSAWRHLLPPQQWAFYYLLWGPFIWQSRTAAYVNHHARQGHHCARDGLSYCGVHGTLRDSLQQRWVTPNAVTKLDYLGILGVVKKSEYNLNIVLKKLESCYTCYTVLYVDIDEVFFILALCVTEVQEPYAVVVLLEKDLIVVDLTQSK